MAVRLGNNARYSRLAAVAAACKMEDEAEVKHLNAIAQNKDGVLVIVGESGTAFRSTDKGANWTAANYPYEGSMFCVAALDNGNFVTFGLRGNGFESADAGRTWNKLDTGQTLSIMGVTPLPGASFVAVGGNGLVIARRPNSQDLETFFEPSNNVLAGALAFGPPVGFEIVSELGILRFQPAAGK
jgi:photosystem II stability/assembly factor-like uncharacterized protein